MGVPLLIMGAIAAGSAVAGYAKSRKAKKQQEMLANSRPELEDSPFLRENINLARNELANGSPSAQAYQQGIDRNLSTSLSTLLQGGGSLNNVATIFDASQQGQQRMRLMQDNLRLNQINNLQSAFGQSEGQRQQQFQFNSWAPWSDQAQSAAQARQSGDQQMWNGITSLGSTIAGGISTQQGANQLNNYFKSNNAGVDGSGTIAPYNQMQQPVQNYTAPSIQAPGYISPNYSNSYLR